MLVTVLLLAIVTALQQDPVMTAVLTAAKQESIEAFGNANGSVTVHDAQLLDVDEDGTPEVFVRVTPSFRQTPTVLVYAYDRQRGARRYLEALVPGRFQEVSGRFQDSHALGEGVDLAAGDPAKPADLEELLAAFVPNGMSLVRYRTFIHGDVRKGFVSYVDLVDRSLPAPTTNTCREFEFSPVEVLVSGTLAGGERTKFLVALTVEDVTIYRFRGIRPNGVFDKQVWARPRPAGVRTLSLSTDGEVQLATASGSTSIAAPR